MLATGLHQYRQFDGLHNKIDTNDFYAITRHPTLATDINEKQYGYTPLYLACTKKNTNIMQYLLSHGADPNLISRNRTPLYISTLYGDESMVQLLLQHGADPTQISNGVAPLHIAAANGIVPLCEMLIQFGASVNTLSPRAGSPIHVAVSRDHRFILACLLKHSPDLSTRSPQGETALHVAARLGLVEITEQLLAHKKSIDAFSKDDIEGNNVLHLAALNGSERVCRLLVNAFPEISVAKNDCEGKTPMFYMSPFLRRSLRESIASKRENYVLRLWKKEKEMSDVIICAIPAPEPNKDATLETVAAPASDPSAWKEIHCHKPVLWARCTALRPKMQERGFPPTEEPPFTSEKIYIKEFSYQVVEAMLYYLYSDTVRCKKHYLADLEKCAAHFDLPRLVTLCQSEQGRGGINPPPPTLRTDMEKLVNNPLFADIKLEVAESHADEDEEAHKHDGPVFAHRLFLVNASPYFRTMFESRMSERASGAITIKQTPARVLLSALRWMYCVDSNLGLSGQTAMDMLELSTRFMLSDLSLVVQDYLAKRVDDTTVCHFFHAADMLEATTLKEECFDYILRHPHIMKTPDWMALPAHSQLQITEYGKNQNPTLGKSKPPVVPASNP